MYVMFPIGIMYYFGTNLDERFAVPDFWPKPEQANRVPFEKEEIHAELERLRARRLYFRDRRLEEERKYNELHGIVTPEPAPTQTQQQQAPQQSADGQQPAKKGWFW